MATLDKVFKEASVKKVGVDADSVLWVAGAAGGCSTTQLNACRRRRRNADAAAAARAASVPARDRRPLPSLTNNTMHTARSHAQQLFKDLLILAQYLGRRVSEPASPTSPVLCAPLCCCAVACSRRSQTPPTSLPSSLSSLSSSLLSLPRIPGRSKATRRRSRTRCASRSAPTCTRPTRPRSSSTRRRESFTPPFFRGRGDAVRRGSSLCLLV